MPLFNMHAEVFCSSFDSVLWLLSSLSDHISFLGSPSIQLLKCLCQSPAPAGFLCQELCQVGDRLSFKLMAPTSSGHLYFFIQVLMHSSTSSLKSFLFNHVPRIINIYSFSFLFFFPTPLISLTFTPYHYNKAKCFYPARYALFILCPCWQQTCGYEEM